MKLTKRGEGVAVGGFLALFIGALFLVGTIESTPRHATGTMDIDCDKAADPDRCYWLIDTETDR